MCSPLVVHTNVIKFVMNYHAGGGAECMVEVSSSDDRELNKIHQQSEQYINTVMPIVVAAIAGICRQFKGHPGCDINKIIERIGPAIQEAYNKNVINTRFERIHSPEEN